MGCLVGNSEGFEVSDLRIAPVTGTDPLQPRTVIEGLRCGKVFPDIRTPGHAAIHIVDELLTDETRHVQKIRCDFQEVLTACLTIDMRRQAIQNECGNHLP